jgi:nucleoside-diphosphate-sugar epimerase
MKVLVTGGSGFIGGSVVRNLLERGIPVVIGEYARDEAVLANLKGAEFELMDVADAESVKRVFARRPDLTHCIHLALKTRIPADGAPVRACWCGGSAFSVAKTVSSDPERW